MTSYKPISTILIEAFVVGVLLIVVYKGVEAVFFSNIPVDQLHPASLNTKNQYYLLFLTGAIFHIICEYTGVNIWYVKEYNKILSKISTPSPGSVIAAPYQ